MWMISGGWHGTAHRKLQREGRHRVVDRLDVDNIWSIWRCMCVASYKEKEDTEWWIVSDVDMSGGVRGAGRKLQREARNRVVDRF
jgi:hypothetical protein